MRWQIITGEYPPQIGGISDYTRLVARGLAALGDRVDIWTGPLPPPTESGAASSPLAAPASDDTGITVHRLPDHFGPRALQALSVGLVAGANVRLDGPPRVLIQYEPWSFGWRGLNLPFCWWFWRRRKRLNITAIFHEVCTDLGWKVNWKHNIHGAVTRVMAGLVVRASRRAFVTIPTWETLLRPLARKGQRIAWLPVPSNMPRNPDAERVRELRRRLLLKADALRQKAEAKRREEVGEAVEIIGRNSGDTVDGLLVGHFGTYRGEVARMLRELLPTLLRECPGINRLPVAAVLVGRSSGEFVQDFERDMAAVGETSVGKRVFAAGALESQDVAEHLAACDLLIQPYPDGISARRSSAAAGIGLGQAIVTNAGELSEPFWRDGAVRLVDAPSPAKLAAAALELLDDAPARERLRAAAAACYEERLDPAKLIAALRAEG